MPRGWLQCAERSNFIPHAPAAPAATTQAPSTFGRLLQEGPRGLGQLAPAANGLAASASSVAVGVSQVNESAVDKLRCNNRCASCVLTQKLTRHYCAIVLEQFSWNFMEFQKRRTSYIYIYANIDVSLKIFTQIRNEIVFLPKSTGSADILLRGARPTFQLHFWRGTRDSFPFAAVC